METLNYIHRNPVQEKWDLSKFPGDYKNSTAKFYETGKDNWGFLLINLHKIRTLIENKGI